MIPEDRKAVIGILSHYNESIKLHSVSDAYIQVVVDAKDCVPFLVPCFAAFGATEIEQYAKIIISSIDGLILPGGRSDIHPSHYGKDEHPTSTIFDHARDETAFPLIREAIRRGTPVLGICRGMQEINCALGGSLHQSLDELADVLDHKADATLSQPMKYGPRHQLIFPEGSWMQAHAENLDSESFVVNSLHRQGIDALGGNLRIDAISRDGVIEAISSTISAAPLMGVQWHPEWHTADVLMNRLVMSRFFDACTCYVREGSSSDKAHFLSRESA